MQINFFICEDKFDENLKVLLNNSKDYLNLFQKILPKRIEINIIPYCSTKFAENIIEIFKNSITSFKSIWC
jgi:hypothetical protein